MLRWSEAMETSDPFLALNPDSVVMSAVQNANFAVNTGGVQFSGNEHLTVLQGSNLDGAGWSATWKLWAGGVAVPTAVQSGVVFCQGDHASGSLTAELRSVSELALVLSLIHI